MDLRVVRQLPVPTGRAQTEGLAYAPSLARARSAIVLHLRLVLSPASPPGHQRVELPDHRKGDPPRLRCIRGLPTPRKGLRTEQELFPIQERTQSPETARAWRQLAH